MSAKVLMTVMVSIIAIGFIGMAMLIYVIHDEVGDIRWTNIPFHMFNIHAILTPIGMFFFMGLATITYRLLRRVRSKTILIVHTLLHVITIVVTAVGTYAAIKGRNLAQPDDYHFFSLHSWLSLILFALYTYQFFTGLLYFGFQVGGEEPNDVFFSHHVIFGLMMFFLAFIITVTGVDIVDTYCFEDYVELSDAAYMMNFVGVAFLIFAVGIFFISTSPYFEWE